MTSKAKKAIWLLTTAIAAVLAFLYFSGPTGPSALNIQDRRALSTAIEAVRRQSGRWPTKRGHIQGLVPTELRAKRWHIKLIDPKHSMAGDRPVASYKVTTAYQSFGITAEGPAGGH